ncbi:flagellar basal-body rod protein FlgG [Dissulfurirhabdus thermomarina]|uniref:Flagellar basal-body rod protein FlgG n=1 Tax=Dissulfurirhabdus thermomarina TaxID=1765737 RepID=A0A6N9TLW2_DISTH|nr:flagellar basal-body rod protein FlgG [Dissulfurirhabdus thermomarina]NDY42262.1 flagellar basal-body rod protein FlgG [Dissulfurirhabdus thermomarina]NMX22767.1 flagellar basal-body rod protein FlgG [Dissulfurirhabdus thermomarina]
MIRGLYSAASGMNAQQLNLDTIANNLANVNTTGFKRSRADFEDLLYQTLRMPGTENADGTQVPTGMQVGMGVRPAAVQKIFTQGDYENTGNELDWAIEGRGFFKIISNGEELYTRAGAFKLDRDGFIVTSNGDRLQPEFAVPNGTARITIDAYGNLVASDQSGAPLASAQLTLYDFPNPAGLYSVGRNLYRPTEASSDPIEGNPGTDNFGTISQGFLEQSNVDVVKEMVDMIITQRAYELNSKAVQTADNMLGMAGNLKR